MNAITQAFLPNRAISRHTFWIIIAFQAAVFLAIWINSPFKVLPQPDEVWTGFKDLWMTQGLARELWKSFMLNLQALGLTLVISLGLSYLTVLPFFRPIALAVSKGRFLGLVGLTVIFTLSLGGGRALKLSLLVFAMTVFFVTAMASVVLEIPRERFDHARTLRMGEWKVVWEVVILGTLDKAMEVLRQNAAIGWMMLTMVEGFVRSEGGVGVLLLNLNKHFLLDKVFAVQLTILLVALLQDYAIGALHRLLFPYARLVLERR